MNEQPQLEDDTKKDVNNVTTSSLSTKKEADVSLPLINDHAIIYICSPNRTKQKQLESILHELNPRCSVHYYTDDNANDDGLKRTRSEENDLMAIGSIRFPTTDQAEKTYALLNGTPLTDSSPSTIIQLRYNTFSPLYRDTMPAPLIIQHLPKTMSISTIYNLLREFGPIAQCRRLNSKETNDEAPVQLTSPIENDRVAVYYFFEENATRTQLKLNNTSLGDSDPITVIAGIPHQQMQDRSPTTLHSAETSPFTSTKSKRKEKHRLSQPSHYEEQQRQPPLLQVEIKPTMDLCNLYVKGLSLSMTSTELFNLFKPYGRIISARVMANDKNVSKGFGFVSFSQPIEAASALVGLHPHYSILFHEPKVPRSDHDIQQQYWSLMHSPLAPYFYSTSVTLPIDPLIPATRPAVPYYYYPPPFPYPSAPPYYYHTPVYYTPYPYPVGTDVIQRSDMQRAVQHALTNEKQQQAMVDRLMALDENEKLYCLEDTDYLKAKLDQLLTLKDDPSS